MGMDWLKLHDEFVNDPKMRRYFTKAERCDWIGVLCLANKSDERGVILLPIDEISYALELTDEEWSAFESRLTERRMVARREDGALVIIKWSWRQSRKPSDSPEAIADRVRRHRENLKNGLVTPRNALQNNGNACNALEESRREESRRDKNPPLPPDGGNSTKSAEPQPKEPAETDASHGDAEGGPTPPSHGKSGTLENVSPPPPPRRRSSVAEDASKSMLAAFRSVRFPGKPPFTATEFKAYRPNLDRLAEDGYSPEQYATATHAAIDRFREIGMVNPRSVANHIDSLLEPLPARTSPQRNGTSNNGHVGGQTLAERLAANMALFEDHPSPIPTSAVIIHPVVLKGN